jgi:hypothetical protein
MLQNLKKTLTLLVLEHSAEVEGDLRRAHARLAATGGIEASH